ncbi:uncharacterized protein LOC133317042 [Gastrolobium bilobum]|uniref:uncharacterized protein LOC133317042 n=1 Tax=Gastrolobium bilobum TaxID=150636 RepID=UPI002AB28817|nr:uncharacterized protein LOC133317042 [Gastrolobium bilobum]
MTLKPTKEISDYLKAEYKGDERIRGMQEYSERLLSIASQISLLDSSLLELRIVENILVIVPEKFEAIITSLENTNDMSSITLAGLLIALQAQEQRRAMRQEGVLHAEYHEADKNKKM